MISRSIISGARGTLSPCIMSKKWAVGSISEASLSEIAAGDALRDTRQRIYEAVAGPAGADCAPSVANRHASCHPSYGMADRLARPSCHPQAANVGHAECPPSYLAAGRPAGADCHPALNARDANCPPQAYTFAGRPAGADCFPSGTPWALAAATADCHPSLDARDANSYS